ncbi:hypothetical protein HPP92_022617 [Vanilla planifolia]|uniref:Uncharacterized protein n=1 Tax=Vanilla planifolia TaxID=51239 RepID=A0A835UE00_VANPL|nr:hypothetical protein HPP92_022901 [Vanilla planifolia]KAG0459489.1 hypothetical protein HPP92_022617 [Vanilla planifolia]
MSLLSYGVFPKEVPIKDDEDPSSPEGSPDITEKKSPSAKKNTSKKRRRGDEKPGKASRMEQEEKEMKKLESFLFGNLYSAVEFGKEIGSHEPRNEGAILYGFDRSPLMKWKLMRRI